MRDRGNTGQKPSLWAVAALCGSSAFLFASLMLMIGNVSPF